MSAAMSARPHPRARERAVKIPVGELRASPYNIRSDLGDLRDLIESIRYEGVLVPLMAEDRGAYGQIIHGHRRWAAAQIAGVKRIPVILVDPHEPHEAMLAMLAEDKKLPVDEADLRRAILSLVHDHCVSYEEIAQRLGYPVSRVRFLAGQAGGEPPTRLAGRPAPPRPGSPRGAGGARPGRHRSDRPPYPRVTPSDVYSIIARSEAGDLGPADIVAELRRLLGTWTPKVRA